MDDDLPQPIDAVITWVDGTDPVHAARRARYRPQHAGQSTEGTSDQRFDQRGEIYLCVASILAFLPFVRRIWIVTDRQRPVHLDAFAAEGICAVDRIVVVDHTEILGDVPGALPTFNSRTIEAALWRIPGLAERYLYFNDDFFVNRPQDPERYFTHDGPVIAGRWRRLWGRQAGDVLRDVLRGVAGRPAYDRPSFEAAIAKAAWRAGYRRRYVRFDHWPHPQRRSVQHRWHQDHPDALATHCAFRFRSRAQVSPISLAYHLEGPARLSAEPLVTYLTSLDPDRVRSAAEDVAQSASDYVVLQNLPALVPEARAGLLAACADKFAAHLPRAVSRMMGGAAPEGLSRHRQPSP